MYHVKSGPANQSYGIQVARLAGLPDDVLKTAQEKLRGLESQQTLQSKDSPQSSINFDSPETMSIVEQELLRLDPDQLSARQALDLIYQLKSKVK